MMSELLDAHQVSVPVDKHLYQGCFCITLDRNELVQSLDREAGEPSFFERLIAGGRTSSQIYRSSFHRPHWSK